MKNDTREKVLQALQLNIDFLEGVGTDWKDIEERVPVCVCVLFFGEDHTNEELIEVESLFGEL